MEKQGTIFEGDTVTFGFDIDEEGIDDVAEIEISWLSDRIAISVTRTDEAWTGPIEVTVQ